MDNIAARILLLFHSIYSYIRPPALELLFTLELTLVRS